MASVGPVQSGGPYLLPPPRDKKLAGRRKTSYTRGAEDAADGADETLEDEYQAELLVRFPPGSGPMSWIARLLFQTYHTVLRPRLGRIVDIIA
ncbi:MAG TPA: hypothetical protein VMV93_01220 [Chloroflexota bacterium]|nr:hypothetical protein [Chloroflexota bacterium]